MVVVYRRQENQVKVREIFSGLEKVRFQ